MFADAPIGQLAIGESGGNHIPPPAPTQGFDAFTTVISQYANSPVILQLCTNITAYLDATANFNAFYDLIWNVDTAVGYGLDVWGRIVDVDRVLHVPSPNNDFGFQEAAHTERFGYGPFFSGTQSTSNFTLSDDAYRRLILAKALANITDCSIPAINQILINLFQSTGNCYVIDGRDMTMTYVFNRSLSLSDITIVKSSGALPRPAGVLSSVLILLALDTESDDHLVTEGGDTLVTED